MDSDLLYGQHLHPGGRKFYEEVLIMSTAEDGKLLRDLINDADTLYWDTQNEVLIFGNVK